MKRWGSFTALLAVTIALLGGAMRLQSEQIFRWRLIPFKFRDTLYLPSSEYVRAVSVGYDVFMSDFLWLRMIQVFAASWTTPDSPETMKHYFDIITDLNPYNTDVYKFAILAVGEEHKRHDMVKEIVNKGIQHNPLDYHIPYEGASYAFMSMEDLDQAKLYVRMAKLDPNYPDFIDRWEGYFDIRQGRYEAAYSKFFREYIEAILADNPQLFDILRTQLNRAMDEWFKSVIREAAVAWHDRTGLWSSVDELNAAGAFQGVRLPDVQFVRGALQTAIEHDQGSGPLPPEQMDALIDRGVKTFDFLPLAPYDFIDPRYQGYVIWPYYYEDNPERFVLAEIKAAQTMGLLASSVESRIQAYRDAHRGQCPPTLEALLGEEAALFTEHRDPFGGQWTWDPATCQLGSTSFPSLIELGQLDVR
ncbi:MAG TPA: hypothetical protein PLS90_12075 [Candidatus Sumerlaeota bacterium]|nr:hypothetical protein [Candidatus Sumerlaeota bacterium]